MKNTLKILNSKSTDKILFIDSAYGVKGSVKENISTIKGSKMGYYFKALRTNLKIS